MKPLAEMSAAEAAPVRFILMDIDDTLTTHGKLSAAAYSALWRLHDAGLALIPVTGRSAGWCDLIAREWPVEGVVGENGAFVFWEERAVRAADCAAASIPALASEFHPGAVRNNHPALARIQERAQAEVPGIRPAKDQFSRLFDLALDFAEEEPVLPLSAAERVRDIALAEGAQAKISSIHVNVWMGNYDKRSMAEQFLSRRFGWDPSSPACLAQVLFAGDSPNDEPMFARFPLACAVANMARYRPYMASLPAFIARSDCGAGFAEIADTLLARRNNHAP